MRSTLGCMAISVDQATSIEASPELEPTQCAVARCAEIVSAKWTMLIVRELAVGPRYYNQLETGLPGISPRTLCERLKTLAAKGFVTRTRTKGLPPRTTYELTSTGRLFLPILETMREVGEILATAPTNVEVLDTCCDDA